MSVLVSVADFRAYSGAASATVPDALIQTILDEAEAGLVADIAVPITTVQASPEALSLSYGETLRRSNRLLARRNSPESISGVGDVAFSVPVRDPDSFRTIRSIMALLTLHEGVA